MEKKIAVVIYPHFSMQEISCLTDALAVWFDIVPDIYASTLAPVRTEDGFQVLADKTLDEFRPEEYACVILPGILNPIPALFDEAVIGFLRGLKGKDILISAISSAPMLLAKAGLLEDVRFTSGIWEEICRRTDFIPHENILRRPLVHDKNIITAIGFAFREFAEETIRTLGIDPCEGGLFKGVYREYSEEELTHYMGEENYAEWEREIAAYNS